MGEESLGQFTLLELVSRDGAELVFRARRATGDVVTMVAYQLGSSAALPVARRLASWASETGIASHPRIPRVLEIGSSAGLAYYTVAASADATLEQVLEGRETLPVDRVLHILGAVAAAIDHLHASGLRHGDLKPNSILLPADGRGALLVGGGVKDYAREVAGTADAFAGSPGYRPPELRRYESAELDDDQYALAVIAWELLTGRRRRVFDASLRTYVLEPITIPLGTPLRPDAPMHMNATINRVVAGGGRRQFETCTAFVQQLQVGTPGRKALSEPHRGLALPRLQAGDWRVLLVVLLLAGAVVLAVLPERREAALQLVSRAVSAVSVRLGIGAGAEAETTSGSAPESIVGDTVGPAQER